MTLHVEIAAAYREACQALGEAMVTQRLMVQHLTTLEAEVQRLTPDQFDDARTPTAPATGAAT